MDYQYTMLVLILKGYENINCFIWNILDKFVSMKKY